jgi:hypothetical protein
MAGKESSRPASFPHRSAREPEGDADRDEGAPTTKARKGKAAANERLRAAVAPLPADAPVPFVCECDDPECLGRVEMTLGEYDEARASKKAIRLSEHRDDEPERSQNAGNGS